MKKTAFSLSLITAIVISVIPSLVIAAPGPNYDLPTCQEAVFPFNLNGALPTGSTDQYMNELSESTCRDHAPYPDAHYTLTNNDKSTHAVTQAAINDNIHAPYTRHHHIFYNNSLEDNYFYKGYVAKFEITVEKDGYSNTNLSNLQCPIFTGQTGTIYDNFKNCVDQAFDPDHFGGIRLHRKNVGNTVVLTWEFGVNGQGGRPWTPGINPSIDITPASGYPTKFSFDTEDLQNRKWAEYVQLLSKDNLTQSIWSGTTTSRILIADAAIHKSAVSTDPAQDKWNQADPTCMEGWCLLNPNDYIQNPVTETVVSNGQAKTYYWHNIGTVSTVWNKEDTPVSNCTGLSIIQPTSPTLTKTGSNPETYEMTPSTETTFGVEPTFSNGEVPLDYKWQATGLTIPYSASTNAAIAQKTNDGYAATLLAATPQLQPSSSITDNIEVAPTPQSIFTTHGFFADDSSKSDLANPYTDTDNAMWWGGQAEDRATYYTGGPAGTLIRVLGVDPATGDYVGNNCQAIVVIPSETEENTCIDLKVNPTSVDENTPVTFTVTPEFEHDTPVIQLDYLWSTEDSSSSSYTPGYFDFNAIDELKSKVQFDDGSGSYTLPDELKKPNVDYEEVTIPVPKPEPEPIDEFKAIDLQANLLAAAPVSIPGSTPEVTIQPNPAVTPLVTNFDKFADSAIATDYANPYTETESTLADDRSTYYTGGNAGQTISVQAFNKLTGEIYPLCKEEIQIPPSMTNNDKCLDLDIVTGQVNPVAVGDEVPLEDPIEGLWVRVNTDPQEYEADLAFDWEVKGGGELYASQTNFGTRVSTTNFADTVNLNGAVEGTTVTVAAVDPENDLENIEICRDQFTVTASPQLMCKDLRLSPSKPVFGPGLQTYLSGSPINTDDSLVKRNHWYEEGPGHFEKGPASIVSTKFPFPPKIDACPDPAKHVTGDVTEFDAPARCDYFYVAGDDGGGLVRVEANPNLGNVDNCIFEATVPSAPGNVECLSLDFDQNELTANDTQTLTGDVTFSDGVIRNVIIEWEGDNASIANPNPQSTSSQDFSKSVKVDDPPAEVTATVIATNDPDVDANSLAQCTDTLSTEPDDCREIELNFDRKLGYVCVDVVDGTYEKEYVWFVEGEELPEEGDCIPEDDFNEDDYLVYAKYDKFDCRLSEIPTTEDNPPEFDKLVRQSSGKTTGYKSVVSASLDPNNPTEFDYELTFTARSNNTTATITDPDMLYGITGHLLPDEYANEYNPGRLEYISGSTRVYGIPACDETEDEEDWDNCYRPYPPDVRYGIDLIKLDDNTEVRITYAAEIIGSPIADPNICREGKVCEEYYENRARADWRIIGSSEQVLEEGTLWDKARIQAFCQYILTRAAGDIFLETDLDYGVDINRCSEFTTSTGVIVTPGSPDQPIVPSTGAGEATIFTINHEICSEGQAGGLSGELTEYYGQDISENLSSQICEVKLQTGSAWKQEVITNSIEENKLRLSRWGADYTGNQTINSVNTTEDVIYISGNLTIPKTGYKLDKGAKTFIIEGDLNINGDITYGVPQGGYESVRDTASLAFVVLGGDVNISNDVTTISGVYFVQEDENGDGGRLYSTPNNAVTYNPLIVYGSIYGDIEPLFGNRLFAGDPSEDAGGIVIRFDQRILLNTPPGLRDVLDVSQTEVAR